MQKLDAEKMKAIVASYWRYDRQCPFVALEASCSLGAFNDGGQADVLVVTEHRLVIETEIKLNLADLRRDKHKAKHRLLRSNDKRLPTHRFYFAVPYAIANQACLICGNLYPYAGVLGIMDDRTVVVYREAKSLVRPKASLHQLRNIAREQSATVCRLAQKVVELNDSLRRTKNENTSNGSRHNQ